MDGIPSDPESELFHVPSSHFVNGRACFVWEKELPQQMMKRLTILKDGKSDRSSDKRGDERDWQAKTKQEASSKKRLTEV